MRVDACQAGLLTLLVMGMVAARAASSAEPTSVPFTTVASGRRSAVEAPLRTVIRDAAGWTALWRKHTGSVSASPPAIDFRRSMVIVVFAGRVPVSTDLAVVRILSEGDRLVVQYRQAERRPPMDDGQETTPFHMVRLPRSGGAVRFQLAKTIPVLPGPGS